MARGTTRGASVAYRVALDPPDRLDRLAILKVISTDRDFPGTPGDCGHFTRENAPDAPAASLVP